MRSPFQPKPSWPCLPSTDHSNACGAASVLVAASLLAVMAAAGVAVVMGVAGFVFLRERPKAH